MFGVLSSSDVLEPSRRMRKEEGTSAEYKGDNDLKNERDAPRDRGRQLDAPIANEVTCALYA